MGILDLLYSDEGPRSIQLPSGRTATIREMTGRQQRMLSDRNKVASGEAFQDLIHSCIDTLDGEPLPEAEADRRAIVLDLFSGDRSALLFEIRRFSLGNDFHFATKCPECDNKGEWEVNLDEADFPIHPYKEQPPVKEVEYISKIKPGVKIRFNLLDGHTEMQIIKARNKADAITDVTCRKPQVWDPEGSRWVGIDPARLGDKFLAEFRGVVLEYEGYKDTSVEVVCPACQRTVKINLTAVQDFMLPKAAV